MDESTTPIAFGDGAVSLVYFVGMGCAICLLLAGTLIELQKMNQRFERVFSTYPLSLQKYKDLEALIGGSSREEAGQERPISPEDS